MITVGNFKAALKAMGFTENGSLYEKQYPAFHCSMRVDFDACKLLYPSQIKGGDRNNGFDAPENFVVFECVDRLLSKGYRPEHIILEKPWHLGHAAKSGRADICVTDPSGVMLFIIECKTWGREFDKALNDTMSDGAQLFSYWQQEQSCRWLILYASDLKNDRIVYKSPAIDCSDDANIVLLAKKDKSIKLYRDAHTTPEKHEVWKETYASRVHDDVIFSEDSTAYQIGVKPLRKKNLREFSPDNKIVNKFEEILRHNNVSDKENAFNRLIALFICKLVDESTKEEDDEVEFQYKQGTDTYETLQDRLQRLHRDGMEKFMREKIFYVPADYPERLFSTYTGTKREKAMEDLRNTIRILKFYSNNDFSFKDVHNEELFYQNGKILVEMVQLFEKYRIVYPSRHQFLGDLFEQLLNKGFKQNEGQFFTPMPMTRFIWDSLPLDRMVRSERGTVYPKVIDYACGAGHFLTEAVEAVNHFVPSDGNNAWAKDHIYGIEKDYRLARVAKISLFMNGAGEGNIIFGDGLENAPDKGIENGVFDILVANPPYSVKDFKQHLHLKNNSFTLLDRIGSNGGEIETLFVERIGQLLKPQGVAAVILPSSILSNDSASYIGAREQILQNFYIRAIAAFGSKTFGATGTNTVVMFLEKFLEPPKPLDLAGDSVDAIFSGGALTDWKDQDIFEAYLVQIGMPEDPYRAFLDKASSIEELEATDYFRMYTAAFAESSDAKNLQRTKAYQNKSPEDQAAVYLEKFYAYAHPIEREKLLYFALVYQQTTVLITAPSDNKEQKEFLGYDWSNRKGNEGIQITAPGGKMYNDSDRSAEGTIVSAIRKSFYGLTPSFDESQQAYGSVVPTKDMLDFSRVSFNKELRLRVEREEMLQTKYPLLTLGEVCPLLAAGGDVPQDNWTEQPTDTNTVPIYSNGTGDKALYGYTSISRIEKDSVTISARGTIGYTAIRKAPFYPAVRLIVATPDESKVKLAYLFEILTVLGFKKAGKTIPQLTVPMVQKKKIPVPPMPVQQQIIEECAKIDKEYSAARQSAETCRQAIEDLFAALDAAGPRRRLSLADTEKFRISIGKRVLNTDLVPEGSIPVYSANVMEPFGNIDKLLLSDFSAPSVLWGIDGDWMTRCLPAQTAFYPTDHCGVLRCATSEVNPRYLAHLLEIEGRKAGFSRSYRASIDRVQGIVISVPDIQLQNETAEKVFALEEQISAAEKLLETISERRTNTVKAMLA